MVIGSPTRSGLPRPDHHFGEALPTVSAELPDLVGAGRITVRPQVSRLDGLGVEFVDGTRDEVDEIIWCTGYRTTTPFLDTDVFSSDDNRVPLYERVFHPDHPSLYFVGMLQAVGWGFLPLFESQARLVAAHLSGRYALPDASTMRAAIAREEARIRRTFVVLTIVRLSAAPSSKTGYSSLPRPSASRRIAESISIIPMLGTRSRSILMTRP